MNPGIKLVLVLLFCQASLFSQAKGEAELLRELEGAEGMARIDLLNQLAKFKYTSKLDQAEQYASQALDLATELGYQKGMFYSNLYLGFISRNSGDLEQDLVHLNRSLAIAQGEGNSFWLVEVYNSFYNNAFHRGNYGQARLELDRAFSHAQEAGDSSLLARINSNRGILSGIAGRHVEAVEEFMKALELYKQLGDSSNVAAELGNIGYTYTLAGSNTQALKYLTMAQGMNQTQNNLYKAGWNLANIAVTYHHMDQDTLALEYYHRSLEVAEKIKDYRLILTNLDNIGGWYSLRGEYTRANEYLGRAYSLSQEVGQNSRTVYISGNLAENHLYAGDLDQALEYGRQQLQLALDQNIINEQKTAYYTLSQVYAGQHRFRESQQALMDYIRVNDTIFNREKSSQIEELSSKYETKIKEQAIANLEVEKETAKAKRNTYLVLGILVVLLLLALFNLQRQRAKRNRLLLEKEREVDRMKSQFFTNIAHEFRTPLSLIMGPVETLISKIEDPGNLFHCQNIKKNAGMLLDQVNQLLDLSKLEAGKFKLQVGKGNIVPIIRGVVMNFHSRAERKNISLELNFALEELICYFDWEKLETILTNLMSNALKFTPENGKVSVSFDLVTQGQGGRIGTLEVRDTGTGIAEAEKAFIFNRFHQSGTVPEQGFQGSGIGLALCRELVELHRGTISVASELGAGSCFQVQLPLDRDRYGPDEFSQDPDVLHEVTASARPPHMVGEILPIREPRATQGLRPLVLLIEDNDDVRLYLSNIFRETYRLIKASDGAAGVERAREGIPDLIISDVMMPKMDGYAVCTTLKKDERTSHIPIILLTAKADSQDRITGLEAKADDYVVKPFHPKELLLRAYNMLEARNKLRELYRKQLGAGSGELDSGTVEGRFLVKLRRKVEDQLSDEHFGVLELGRELGMSRSQLHRKLKALIDQSPSHFIQGLRLKRAYDLLVQKAATASEIGYQVGFASPSYFTKCFHRNYGRTPSQILREGH